MVKVQSNLACAQLSARYGPLPKQLLYYKVYYFLYQKIKQQQRMKGLTLERFHADIEKISCTYGTQF